VMELGGVGFGGSIPSAALQQGSGSTEAQLLRVPTVTLTEEMIAEHCRLSGQDECECALCLEALQPGELVARLSCGHIFHRSPPLPSR
jgi:hypothetical protein